MKISSKTSNDISFEDFRAQILQDYETAYLSRICSLIGRKEVLTGKAKFGIFGDGKELPQLAMARSFQNVFCVSDRETASLLSATIRLLQDCQLEMSAKDGKHRRLLFRKKSFRLYLYRIPEL